MRRIPVALMSVVLVAALALPGCGGRGARRTASGPETFQPEPLAGNEAVIYVFREGGGPSYELTVDQQDVGLLRSGQYRTIVVTPGEHYVRVTGKTEGAREVVVGPGESAYVRVYSERFHRKQPLIEVLGPETGRKSIARKSAAQD